MTSRRCLKLQILHFHVVKYLNRWIHFNIRLNFFFLPFTKKWKNTKITFSFSFSRPLFLRQLIFCSHSLQTFNPSLSLSPPLPLFLFLLSIQSVSLQKNHHQLPCPSLSKKLKTHTFPFKRHYSLFSSPLLHQNKRKR